MGTVLVVSDEPQSLPGTITFLGVELPASVWRDVAIGLSQLEVGDCDQVVAWKKGRTVKVKRVRFL